MRRKWVQNHMWQIDALINRLQTDPGVIFIPYFSRFLDGRPSAVPAGTFSSSLILKMHLGSKECAAQAIRLYLWASTEMPWRLPPRFVLWKIKNWRRKGYYTDLLQFGAGRPANKFLASYNARVYLPNEIKGYWTEKAILVQKKSYKIESESTVGKKYTCIEWTY